jgi:enolase
MQENKEGLELLKAAIEKAGYTGKVLPLFSTLLTIQPLCIVNPTYLWQVVIGMDVAASEFFSEKDKTYDLNFKEEVRIATSYYAFIYF